VSIHFKRFIPVFFVLALVSVSAAGGFADGVIHNLKSKLTDRELLVFYQLRGAVNDEAWRVINSGDRLIFDYDVQLVEEHRFWFDRKLAQISLSNSVKLDTLTSQYHLQRQLNGEMVETRTTTRNEEVEKWLTEIENLRVINRASLSPRSSYLLQVRAHLKSDFIFYIVPWEVYTPWESTKIRVP
jgi:hypothetical protein